MVNPQIKHLSAMKRTLENPYAYADELDALRAESAGQPDVSASDAEVTASRKLLENPYAHVDGLGGFSGLKHQAALAQHLPRHPVRSQAAGIRTTQGERQIAFNDTEIEAKVRELHERLWRERNTIWGGSVPADPIHLLDPAKALSLVGYDFQLDDGLGRTRGANGMLEVAGIIDRASRTVRVSSQFPNTVRAFTAAHELGHAVLHQFATGVHRDKPLDGVNHSRERSEVEADKFATYFLMPAKLVKARFQELFGVQTFSLTEESAFALTASSLSELQAKLRTRRDLSRILAGVQRYNGLHMQSLAEQFCVSVEAMAIRLEELGLLPA